MYPYIDIHTHHFYQGDNTRLIVDVFPEENEKFRHPSFFSVGLHPWYIRSGSMAGHLEWIEKQAENPQVLAIGEIGLDKTIDVSWEDQSTVFEKQLSLAERLGKPVILHCVKSYNELIAYRDVSNQRIPWIFHWFNTSAEIAGELMRRNCYLSFGNMLFRENSKAFAVFSAISLDAVFFETDDTEYTIRDVYERAVQIKNMKVSALMQQIEINFTTCFGNR